MATGVKPRDEDHQLTRTDLEAIQDAMKCKKFRDLLNEYCEEVRDPANQALYQKEMTQLEKERGYDVTFINPKGGYVIKTSVAGDRKAFINICSNDNVGKPSYKVQELDGQRGMNWQIPYSIIPPREDFNNKREKCVIYDVVYHPDTLRMAEVNKQFRELVNKTAFDGLQKTYNIQLDSNNCRFPKSFYKGMTTPAVIRKEDPKYKPPKEDEVDDMSPELLEKLYPQHVYPKNTDEAPNESYSQPQKHNIKLKDRRKEFTCSADNGYTLPKYVIKQQKNIDFQDFTYHKDSKQYSAIPSHIVIEINLPLLSSTKDCTLDVQEKTLKLISEKPAKYKLDISLPYSVNDECGHAKFDKSKRMLIVTLPVIRKNSTSDNYNSLKVDSGVESEENCGSQSEDENIKDNLIFELSSKSEEPAVIGAALIQNKNISDEAFLDSTLGYILPSYTHNVLDDIIAFTFHVKNTEPDSVKVKKDCNKIFIKFTSIGSGFVPVHYAAIIIFDESVKFENVTGEAWDNNVILQIEVSGDVPQKFEIGLHSNSMTSEYFDVSHIKKTTKEGHDYNCLQSQDETSTPVVEVTNLGTETNIVLMSNVIEYNEDDIDSPLSKDEEIVWTDPGTYECGAKSILRKPMNMMRSFSESSVGDVASSMDYISSDCIPEESSLKKTVRFNDVIAKQFYRYNSSIEGQKKKNQRKKSKKRNQERRKSESEAEDDYTNTSKETSKTRLKSALKQRRDSGLVDTSDAETDFKTTLLESQSSYDSMDSGERYSHKNDFSMKVHNSLNSVELMADNIHSKEKNSAPAIREADPSYCETMTSKIHEKTESHEPITCDNIKHNTNLYNPDKLNKGQYLEVSFKNDLIFDLDM